MIGKCWFSMGFDGIYPPGVIKHGWLENPRTELRFLARKINYRWSIFLHTIFDYRSAGGYMDR